MKQQLKEWAVFFVLVLAIGYPVNYILEAYSLSHWLSVLLFAGFILFGICSCLTRLIFHRNQHFYCKTEIEQEGKCPKQCNWCYGYYKHINKK